MERGGGGAALGAALSAAGQGAAADGGYFTSNLALARLARPEFVVRL